MKFYVDEYTRYQKECESQGEFLCNPNKGYAYSLLRRYFTHKESNYPIIFLPFLRTDYTNCVALNKNNKFYGVYHDVPSCGTNLTANATLDDVSLLSAKAWCDTIIDPDSTMQFIRSSTPYPCGVFVRPNALYVVLNVVTYYSMLGTKIKLKEGVTLVPFSSLTLTSDLDRTVRSLLTEI